MNLNANTIAPRYERLTLGGGTPYVRIVTGRSECMVQIAKHIPDTAEALRAEQRNIEARISRMQQQACLIAQAAEHFAKASA